MHLISHYPIICISYLDDQYLSFIHLLPGFSRGCVASRASPTTLTFERWCNSAHTSPPLPSTRKVVSVMLSLHQSTIRELLSSLTNRSPSWSSSEHCYRRLALDNTVSSTLLSRYSSFSFLIKLYDYIVNFMYVHLSFVMLYFYFFGLLYPKLILRM